jgi:hypothetical protein
MAFNKGKLKTMLTNGETLSFDLSGMNLPEGKFTFETTSDANCFEETEVKNGQYTGKKVIKVIGKLTNQGKTIKVFPKGLSCIDESILESVEPKATFDVEITSIEVDGKERMRTNWSIPTGIVATAKAAKAEKVN